MFCEKFPMAGSLVPTQSISQIASSETVIEIHMRRSGLGLMNDRG